VGCIIIAGVNGKYRSKVINAAGQVRLAARCSVFLVPRTSLCSGTLEATREERTDSPWGCISTHTPAAPNCSSMASVISSSVCEFSSPPSPGLCGAWTLSAITRWRACPSSSCRTGCNARTRQVMWDPARAFTTKTVPRVQETTALPLYQRVSAYTRGIASRIRSYQGLFPQIYTGC